MNARFSSSVLSVLILFVSATVASAQSVLLFTFDDSGPNVTATVTGSFDTSGLSFTFQVPPNSPDIFLGASANFLTLGTTTATNVDLFTGAHAPGSVNYSSLLANFPTGDPSAASVLVTPLSEYLQLDAFNFLTDPNFSNTTIGLAEGETIFNADTLENNVLVFAASSLDELGDSSFLSTTPTTVLSVPNGGDTIQFVLAAPEILLCDVNLDGEVNFSDIPPFIEALLSDTYLAEADCNSDGEVNFSDIPPFIAILMGG